MKKTSPRRIEVFAHWIGFTEPMLVGILSAIPSRGKEIFSFEYDHEWLNSGFAQALDPALGLYRGSQYVPEGQTSFGVFLDSSPDRWGRVLMRRKEAQLAREAERPARSLLESDYLLGVYDGHRLGGLRFKTDSNGPFLDDNMSLASPPWAALRELEHASLQLEKDDVENDPDYAKWLRMLISPGASLGGARPKASITDEENHLWIAKFPSRHDDVDVGGWEKVVHSLAIRAGIASAESNARKFNSRHHTFLTRRFDRTKNRERIHFASAMTLLQRTDGDDASSGASYLELAEFITQQGARVEQDLEQLWRRIVFFIAVSNIDDHLRNHGFILSNDGWALAPAYDMNAVPSGDGLKLNISDSDNSQDYELAISVAQYFRVNVKRATEIVEEVIKVVSTWRTEASKLGISSTEQDRMSSAFRV
jgi:serine/threonine-protein kinase HipA